MRVPEILGRAEIVRSFAEFERVFVRPLFRGKYGLLIVVGRPGLSKSYAFEKGCKANREISYLVEGGRLSAFEAYKEVYRHRNKLLILDDAENLAETGDGRRLIRQATETRPRKSVRWNTANRQLEKEGIPKRFTTSSKVAIVCNRFFFGEETELEAILDRGHLLYFDPPPLEVHKVASRWFWDAEIFEFIGERLNLMFRHSARAYIKAWERKQSGGDWRKFVLENLCHQGSVAVVEQLEADTGFGSVAERVREFKKLTGGCRATYFNIKRKLSKDRPLDLKLEPAPKLTVKGKPPQEIDIRAEVAAAQAELEDEENAEEEWNDEDAEERSVIQLDFRLPLRGVGKV